MQKPKCGGTFQKSAKMELIDEDTLLGVPKQPPLKRSKKLVYGPFFVEIYTSYLGQVKLNCTDRGDGDVALVATVPGNPNIHVKEVSASFNQLNPKVQNYSLQFLASLSPVVVNVAKCASNWTTITQLKDKPNKTQAENNTLLQALIYNNAVDVHFLTCLYVSFLHNKIGINNVIQSNMLLSIVDVKNFDNAFFSGSYMVYGDGATLFYPMGAPDITGHELGHGIVQTLCGLEYEGHAGALNESFADVFGDSFEYYLYTMDKTDDLKGGGINWTLGEDVGKTMKYIRDMSDPTRCQQPKMYRGEYWADPNDSDTDDGGVHTNSGVGNFLFFNCTQTLNRDTTLNLFVQCLKSLPRTCNYLQYRDKMKIAAGPNLAQVHACLQLVDLTDNAVNDWNV